MKKMLKVIAVALLTVSLMASMVLNASAEEVVEAFVEIVEEEPALAEEMIAAEAPIAEEAAVEEQIAEEQVIEEVVEETVEEQAIEEIVEEQVIEETVEAPVRKVSFTFSWDGNVVEYGDEIKLVAVLSGYEGVDYELVWQYSTDNANWNNYATGDVSYTITEENVSWYWRLVVNTAEEQAA